MLKDMFSFYLFILSEITFEESNQTKQLRDRNFGHF